MKFVEGSFDYIYQEPGLEGMYRMMERAARTCYKTENLIKDGSAHKIIDDVCIAHGHTSVTEFGTVYLKFSIFNLGMLLKYFRDRYTRIRIHGLDAYVTTTYRTIIQGDYKDPVESIKNNFDKHWKDDLKYWVEPTEYHHKRYCYHFVMDRVGSQSVERHRGVWGVSYAQESTRYINYNRDKFDKEITIVYPAKFYDLIDKWSECVDSLTGESFAYIKDAPIEEQYHFLLVHDRGWCAYVDSMENAEINYMYLVGEEEWRPEDARGVLNLDIKTEFVMCAYEEDWRMFLFRRNDSHAHHQIQKFAKALQDDFDKRVG